jgi:hypothetical protein
MISPIYQVANQEFLPANYWTFRVFDDPTMEFKVKSCTLPYEKLIHKTISTGEKFWDKWEGIETFTVEFYETKTFYTYDYFQRWFDSIYDRNRRVFRVLASAEDATVFKNCILTFSAISGPIEAPIKIFNFSKVRVVEISETSLNYDSGDPLVYSITFISDEHFSY